MSRKASGLKAWALQRLTAIYIGLFSLYLLLVLLFAAPDGYIEWKAWLGGSLVSVAMLLYVLSVLMHAWIGVRDVLIDYIHPIAIRAALLGVVGLSLVAMGLWAAQALILVRLA
ncbi:MAG: succinate dehydrogenase, hydrophobic membrane anchor protein [Gammaproteobacteria bacterium]|nr:succinate dehydrogenase, hydrophobic membrane anchor protein [Gammaproteobacteria bacterium]